MKTKIIFYCIKVTFAQTTDDACQATWGQLNWTHCHDRVQF